MECQHANISLDCRVANFFYDRRSSSATAIAEATMNIGGSPLILGSLCLLVGAVCLWHALHLRWPISKLFYICAPPLMMIGLSVVTASRFKEQYKIHRPDDAFKMVTTYGYSLPSTHAALTISAAIGLTMVLVRVFELRWRYTAILSALAALSVIFVAICMMYLGAHWLSDIIAGWMLGGFLGTTGVIFVRQLFEDQNTAERSPDSTDGPIS